MLTMGKSRSHATLLCSLVERMTASEVRLLRFISLSAIEIRAQYLALPANFVSTRPSIVKFAKEILIWSVDVTTTARSDQRLQAVLVLELVIMSKFYDYYLIDPLHDARKFSESLHEGHGGEVGATSKSGKRLPLKCII
jgi:hypothetical protein